ncbi:hypothetical protein [Brevibacillus laterosporus]|uniref:Uncharacterized protein n=1 Tax=Brevibacillus laterosporus TaxID=1465 RepID=A0AAP3DJL9_BRELA|nr:hypothetical protein [Brevibacillus laterosporus]MCR8982281.1 hypothetical protein [Brevibacillus laterosporus]MCZ0809436.1 hypothetical protein [Brevibacillus laterosporus]MCZ0827849.1 hypothetical protein [Brevibacillus laterosporus]MCZ0851789.1 hypothetical protein [Brevibacillus laterosporus]
MKNVDRDAVIDHHLGQLSMLFIGLVIILLGFSRWFGDSPIHPVTMVLLSLASVSYAIGDFGKYLNKPGLYTFCYALAFVWGIGGLVSPQFGFVKLLPFDISGFTDFATLFAFSIPFISRGIWSVLPMKKDDMPHHHSSGTSSDT